jgi:hypothetical protein
MNFLALLVSSTVQFATPVAACSVPPQIYVAVLLDDSAVQTRTDLTLAQLNAMRQQAGGVDRHPTLGFYGHRFGYTVQVDIAHAEGSPCVGSVKVGVHMVLSQRVIEIAKDLTDNPCLFAIAQAHYLRHAAADNQVFADYARMVGPALRATQLLPSLDDYTVSALRKADIEKLVHSTVDATLVPYDAARRTAQLAVDTKAEAVKMVSGCTSSPAPHDTAPKGHS